MDPETAELIQVLRNSTRNEDSVFARAARRLQELCIANACLLELTECFPTHPEGYEGPCNCRECQAAAAVDVAPTSRPMA
jgi:hypothetical protein